MEKKKKKSSPKKPWTEEENELLMQHLQSAETFKQAFCLVAVATGRTESAVSGHWYAELSKSPAAEHTLYYTVGRKKYARNRRRMVTPIENDTLHEKSWWERLLTLLFGE